MRKRRSRLTKRIIEKDKICDGLHLTQRNEIRTKIIKGVVEILCVLCANFVSLCETLMQKVQCAAITAGGQSSRMGRDKALIPFSNQPLVAHIAHILAPIFPKIIVVTANETIARAANLPAVPDQFPQRGPLAGIHAALSHFGAPTFIVACDMPFLNADFIRYFIQDFEGAARVPLSDGGFEPLHAIYAPACVPTFEHHLRGASEMPPMRRVLEEVGASWVAVEVARRFDGDLKMFENWNTPADIE